MRINTNVSAINTHRNLTLNNRIMSKNMERLSSGLKINRGADGPASLVISERLRAQSSGLKQAIDNSEAGVSLMQTAEAALDEVSRALIGARQLAVHAANEAVNDDFMLQADQQEINNILATVNRIAQNTQYGTKNLLDGSKGGNGVTSGENLEFVGSSEKTKTSGAKGYQVAISRAATRATVRGSKALTAEDIQEGVQITIQEGSKSVTFNTLQEETVEANLNALEHAIKEAGLNVDMVRSNQTRSNPNQGQHIIIRHQEYGNDHSFTVASDKAGILSQEKDIYDTVKNGLDVEGEINGEEAIGEGQILTGAEGSQNVEGLSIRYTGNEYLYQAKDDNGLTIKDENEDVVKVAGAIVPNNLDLSHLLPGEQYAFNLYDNEGNRASELNTQGNQTPETNTQGNQIPETNTQGNQTSEQENRASGFEIKTKFKGSVTFSQTLMRFQIGGNANQTTGIAVQSMRASKLGRGLALESQFKSLQDINVLDHEKAQDSIRVLDKSLEEVSSTRARLGAFQKNNLESNLNYLRHAFENVTSSESVIRDADMANEMIQFTRNQIMTESATAMLAQANQRPNSVLQLLS